MKRTNYKEAKEVINSLNSGNFYCECPCGCGEIKLKDAGLFYLNELTDDAKEAYKAMQDDLRNSD